MIAQGLNRLMSCLKVTPDQIENPGRDRSCGVQIESALAFSFWLVLLVSQRANIGYYAIHFLD